MPQIMSDCTGARAKKEIGILGVMQLGNEISQVDSKFFFASFIPNQSQ